jgi:hypothetical protein
MIDQAGNQHATDPVTGEEIGPDSDPNLIGVIAGVIWNSQYATLTKAGNKGEPMNKMAMDYFALVISLCPEEKDMRYETRSVWLIEQWNDMMHWESIGYEGLDREQCMSRWREIMKYVDEANRGVQMVQIMEENDSALVEAAQLCAIETVHRLKEFHALPVDMYRQPEAQGGAAPSSPLAGVLDWFDGTLRGPPA